MALLQQTQVGKDLQGCGKHLGWLWAIVLKEWVGHDPGISRYYRTSILAYCRYVPVLVVMAQAWLSGRCCAILAAPPRLS
ncbi:hypothetical protein OH686_03005 [Pseudomonas sp. SO81]|nr:hypothetical protein OH686_03005 [Pseudomonas sp. SO81]